jgi:hypothetical protein
MDPAFTRLLASPDCYLHSLDGGMARLVPMDRASYRRSIFLDHRIALAPGEPATAPMAEVAATMPAVQQAGWIFHVAHCGSTLLARALEELTGGLVLREPLALRQVALDPAAEHLETVLGLVARRYPGGGPTVIKANVPVNFILDRIAAYDSAASAILLFSRLPDYLLAILRSPTHRNWVRTISAMLANHLPSGDARTDAELAAALWLAQHQRFAATLSAMPQARTLEAEQFFIRPAAALVAAAQLYGLAGDAAMAARTAAGPLFGTYSKNPGVAFDNAARIARRDALLHDLRGELDQAAAWLDRQGTDPDRLSATLTAASLIP